jgi:hypothetical protein
LVQVEFTDLDARLQRRFEMLVSEHLSPADRLAAGLRTLPGTGSAMAATQAAWRFYHNDSVSLSQIFSPVLSATVQAVSRCCSHFVLVPVDWCNLHYAQHARKDDRVALSQSKDLGYELLTGLAINDRDGQPLGPLWQELRAADGVHATHCDGVRPAISVLDELDHNMYFTKQLGLGKQAVFIIDAEADSVAHMRRCHASGHLFLFRCDAGSSAMYAGESRKLSAIGDELRSSNQFRFNAEVQYKQQTVQQWAAEAAVVLTRPAYPYRKGEKRKKVPGEPLPLRLVVTELRDDQGKVLAVWYLLTNVPVEVSMQQIAMWYYWRWKIESYHKLLKSAGQQVEQWQQESGEAVARRLAVVSMACVIVWHLQADESPQADELRQILVRLSGRQMKYGKKFTAPALLAGFWVLLAMLDLLETHDLQELRELTRSAMPWPRPKQKMKAKDV